MAPLNKEKVINKVNGQFGTTKQPKGARWINQHSGYCNIRQVSKCSSLLLNGKAHFSKVKVILGDITVFCVLPLSSTKANDN